MFYIPVAFTFSVLISAIYGNPIHKRVDQIIDLSTQPWENACDPCAQQNASDSMIDLAKKLNHHREMIRLTQIFAQQPRNSNTGQAVPYCQIPPRNHELNGLYQCQFESVNFQNFEGNLKPGSPGTIPYGLTAPVNPPGSCYANPSGPIPDGVQLVTITQNPGVDNVSGSSTNGNDTLSATTSYAAAPTANPASNHSPGNPNDGDDDDDAGSATAFISSTNGNDTLSATTAAPTATSALNHSSSNDGDDDNDAGSATAFISSAKGASFTSSTSLRPTLVRGAHH
ncbi:hypothetical protein EW026_g6974 [Hermanssonia centrifuga]|uniref:Uncharacterized protein n=1 Tax=Hermanssonia centrifuga TaxID=98765 RepID=A0A4S4K9B6_9APHY|nr:hypothetical protein EW026_g6974 [Hermanssonia centrifuga]